MQKKKDQKLSAKSAAVDRRVQIVLIGCIAIFSILLFRLWTIQIFQQDKYQVLAEKNYSRNVPILSERGKILDRKGRILAEDVNFWDVWLPIITDYRGRRVVTDEMDRTLRILSGILERPYETLKKRYLTQRRDFYYKQNRVCVAKGVRFSDYAAIQTRMIEFDAGAIVYTEEVPSRRYLYEDSAAHILGYTGEIDRQQLNDPRFNGYSMGDRIGKAGVEKQYEYLLRGKDGVKKVMVDKNDIQQGAAMQLIKAVPGNDVVLNLDIDLQRKAEEVLGASPGVIIVSKPDNGAVLAMASNPRFDPNHYAEYLTATDDPLYHKAIKGTYPPGSVFKIFETLPLLESLGVDPSAEVVCNGVTYFGNHSWRCHKRGGHGPVDMIEAITVSCNCYFYEMIGRHLGEKRLYNMAVDLGFTTPTGIDLPEETNAQYPTRATQGSWYTGDTVNLSIGQGYLRLTPIQIATALNAIANRGHLYQPRVARMGLDPEGEVIDRFEPIAANEIEASTKTWETIHTAMCNVIDDQYSGTGRRIREGLPVQVAGKTGTAQTSDPQERTHAWFVCFAPAEAPEISITVLTELAGHGGEKAAPLAREIIDYYFGQSEIASNPNRGGLSG